MCSHTHIIEEKKKNENSTQSAYETNIYLILFKRKIKLLELSRFGNFEKCEHGIPKLSFQNLILRSNPLSFSLQKSLSHE
jgi:hypothetical protein